MVSVFEQSFAGRTSGQKEVFRSSSRSSFCQCVFQAPFYSYFFNKNYRASYMLKNKRNCCDFEGRSEQVFYLQIFTIVCELHEVCTGMLRSMCTLSVLLGNLNERRISVPKGACSGTCSEGTLVAYSGAENLPHILLAARLCHSCKMFRKLQIADA